MSETCKKEVKEEKYVDLIVRVIHQFLKCFLILSVIFILIMIRKGMKDDLTIARIISYILLACIGMVTIYMADSYAYNNLLVGIGAYFGFELIKLV